MTEQDLCKKYLGIPYEHHGRTMKGLDCWGLIILAYKDFGIDVVDLEHYDYNWFKKGEDYFTKKYYLENYYKLWKRTMDPKFMDLAMFENSIGVPHHAGICLSDGRFLQCAIKVGVIVSTLDVGWEKKLRGFYRYTPVKEGTK
jgi:cell wall-associated NlpC family hydrolase